MENSESKSNSSTAISVSAIILILTAVVIVKAGNPENIWGLVGLFALSNTWLAVLAIAAILLVLFGGKIIANIAKIARPVGNPQNITITVSALVVAALVLWLLRSSNFLLGDGFLLIGMIHEGTFTVSAESLTVLIHAGVHKLLLPLVKSPALFSFRIVSIFAGLIYLYGTLLLSKALFAQKELRIFSMVSFFALGIVQLFFGYIEFYALPTALTPLLFYFVLQYIRKECSIFIIFGIFALMSALHLVAVSLGPAMLILLYIRHSKNPFYKLRNITALILVLASAALAIVFLNRLGGHVFVSVTSSEQFPYTFLSMQHLTDLLNQIALVCLFSLFLLILILIFRGENRSDNYQTRAFSIVAITGAIAALLFSSVIDPKLGAFRDWDLQGFFAVPVHVAVLSFIGTNKRISEFGNQLTAVAIAFALFITFPWIFYNHAPVTKTLDTTVAVVENDIHYTTEYDSGARMVSWAVIMTDLKTEAFGNAERVTKKFLSKNPTSIRARHILGYAYMMQGNYEQSYQSAIEVLNSDAMSGRYALQTAQQAVLAGHYKEGLEYLDLLIPADSSLPIVVGIMAQANYGLGNMELAKQQYFQAMLRGNKDLGFMNAYANMLFESDLTDSSANIMKLRDSLIAGEKEFK